MRTISAFRICMRTVPLEIDLADSLFRCCINLFMSMSVKRRTERGMHTPAGKKTEAVVSVMRMLLTSDK